MAQQEDSVLDSETRIHDDHHQSLRLWLRMLTCSNLVENQLRNFLREEFNSTLPRFDFLAQVERHPDGIKMGDLSKLMMVSGGNVTGIATQLEKDGLIKRRASPEDGRSFEVRLTAKGKRDFTKMATAHETWIIEMFDGLNSVEINNLYELLGSVKQQLVE